MVSDQATLLSLSSDNVNCRLKRMVLYIPAEVCSTSTLLIRRNVTLDIGVQLVCIYLGEMHPLI